VESVVNVSQIITVDRKWLDKKSGKVDPETMLRIDDGIRLALAL
jgi:mRNA-degrading endonuclease toxin of MazEF toxin-antitoxin module